MECPCSACPLCVCPPSTPLPADLPSTLLLHPSAALQDCYYYGGQYYCDKVRCTAACACSAALLAVLSCSPFLR